MSDYPRRWDHFERDSHVRMRDQHDHLRSHIDSDWHTNLCAVCTADRDSDPEERFLFDRSGSCSERAHRKGLLRVLGALAAEDCSATVRNVDESPTFIESTTGASPPSAKKSRKARSKTCLI